MQITLISPPFLRIVRLLLGLAIWCGLILMVGRLLTEHRGEGAGTLSQLDDYLRGESASATVLLPRRYFVELGDAVFLEGEKTVPIGEVEALLDDKDDERPEFFGLTSRVRVEIYDRDRVQLYEDAAARLVLVPDAFVWASTNAPLLTSSSRTDCASTMRAATDWSAGAEYPLRRASSFAATTPPTSSSAAQRTFSKRGSSRSGASSARPAAWASCAPIDYPSRRRSTSSSVGETSRPRRSAPQRPHRWSSGAASACGSDGPGPSSIRT